MESWCKEDFGYKIFNVHERFGMMPMDEKDKIMGSEEFTRNNNKIEMTNKKIEEIKKELKEVRAELKAITNERRELLKGYRYWNLWRLR